MTLTPPQAARMKNMRSAARLKYGQTPFDRLTRKQLLRLVCTYHAALASSSSCLRVSRCGNEQSPYFGPDGSAGMALAMADYLQGLAGERTDMGSEKVYRSFFREARDLLFPGVHLSRGFGPLYICETCRQMASGTKDPPSRFCKCAGAWRALTLADIRPDMVTP